jgi:tRNA dimethylallyltransferase
MPYTEASMRPLIVVLGPTATGKSSLAMYLAQEFGGEIINADALQVYRGLDVGTAKPSPDDRQRVPHHLVDILDPRASFSAGEFARRARLAIAGIRQRSRLAVVVGGSGLYLRALLEGLSPVPAIPGDIRRELRRRLEIEGPEILRAELRAVDPESERQLSVGDTQRLLRGLEVWIATSRTLSSWRREESPEERFEAVKIGLTIPRALLYDRIAQRAQTMIDAGWVEEVRALLDSGLSGSEPAFQAIGYRQLVDHVRKPNVSRHGSGANRTSGGTRRRILRPWLAWFEQNWHRS